MGGAQTGWFSEFSAWFFWINAIVCIALIVAVVQVEKKHRRKIKELKDALNDPAMLDGPALKEKLALRLRIKDILEKHEDKASKSAISKAKTK